jgi:hypothetical protein
MTRERMTGMLASRVADSPIEYSPRQISESDSG